jgi:nucleoside-diphosphate-sugar epimerase
LAIQDYDVKPKRILITGSNSGIGLDAAQRMALRGHEIVLACVSLSLYAFCWIYLLVFEVY